MNDAQRGVTKETVMHYMLCRNRVSDYEKWREVFDSHAGAHREHGLHLLHLLRELDDPNMVVFLFRADDLALAKKFVQAPTASQAAAQSGVVGRTEITILSD